MASPTPNASTSASATTRVDMSAPFCRTVIGRAPLAGRLCDAPEVPQQVPQLVVGETRVENAAFQRDCRHAWRVLPHPRCPAGARLVGRAQPRKVRPDAAALAPQAVALQTALADEDRLASAEVRRGIASRDGLEI